MPDKGRVGVRAARLGRAKEAKEISEQFFRNLFGQVDAGGAIGAAENFTEGATFQFANYPPVKGRTEIAKFVMRLFTMACAVKHELGNYWRVDNRQVAVTNGEVTFTRHDFTQLVVPFATVSHFTADGKWLTHHQVYVDVSELVPASAPQPS
jgi:hypothetical protein